MLIPPLLDAQGGPLSGSTLVITISPSSVTQNAFTGPYTAVFTVKNQGTTTVSGIGLSCSSGGSVTCAAVSPATYPALEPGASFPDTVTYNVGDAGAASVTLNAVADVGGSAHGTQAVGVAGAPTITIVAPVLTSGSRALVRTRQPIIRATFLPNYSPVDTTGTVVVWRSETVTQFARVNRGLIEWEPDSARWLGIGDSAQISVTACSVNGYCHTATRWAVLLNDQKPVLGFSGMQLEALGRQFAAPFGPGLGVSGAEVETGFSAPPYFSLGNARSAGLVYSTRQSYPRVLVPVDLELTWPAGTPDQITLTLFDGATTLQALVLPTPACATGPTRRCRAVLQGDFATSSFSIPTRKWLTVEARVTSGQTTQIGADSVEVVLVDRRSTLYGSGWWPAGVPKLVGAGSDRLLVGSTGATAVYRGFGDSLYLAPPGDFTVLTKTGSGWELSPRGSAAKLVFDASGRLAKSVDQNGNRDSIVYNGASDQVTTLIDPVGKTIAFAYDGNGKLSTITDPGGRQTKLTVNGTTNQLTYDSLSSPTTRSYTATYVYATYPGTNTVVLTKRIGVITDTTIVTYDSTFTRRPVQTRLPQVTDENGTSVNPVVTYTAYERQGYGALVSLDSVYVLLKDPRNNWTRSLLNRWGETRKTWDSLGVISRTEYTPEGFVLWAEGKVPDSSRVYSSYDALRRLVKSYIVRATNDTLRLDSLVYDANHRVIQRIDPRGQISQTAYDANGNDTASITPTNDTTRFWYQPTGLLDSTRAPGNTVSRKFAYDATWKNLSQVTAEDGGVVAKHAYDAVGRDTAPDTKVRVKASPVQWQWRRVQTFFNMANQVDSTRLVRTDTCADPCTPPTWPTGLDTDTTHVERVRHQFDRAGRDSLRINDRNVATLYTYDRLGRVLSRRPWTDSMAVKDSMLYDVAGNLKKTITRRGDVLTTDYDSRNRDTLSVIPGVGTLRKAYAGPADQVTRMWYDNPVDPIGGVTAELRWGFDLRGRLVADTSFTGSAARATRYTYDVYERRRTRVDALGTWTAGYETSRGYPDSLLTPLGDTITYTFDPRSRPLGPTIKSGAEVQTTTPSWNAAGELTTLPHVVSGSQNYTPGKYTRGAFVSGSGAALIWLWNDQHGSAAPVDEIKDTVTYDAYQRVTFWQSFKNNIDWDDVTVSFDRVGNVATPGGGETYDVTTSRLTAGAGTYSYDRAGNLIQLVSGTTTWTYGYDALNRLSSVTRNSVLIARYGYDVLGRRIVKRVYSNASGGTVAYTRFVYQGASVTFETDSGGTIGLRYTWGLGSDNLLAMRDAAGNHLYVVQDPLGSVRALVKRGGTWLLSARYEPYGLISKIDSAVPGPGIVWRYRWTGREYDAETGWYFHRSRYYDPIAKRFVQEDPIGYGGGSNVYAYVDGNVLEATDPSGALAIYRMYEPDYSFHSDLLKAGATGPDILVDGVEVSSGLFGALANARALRLAPDPFGRNAFLRPTQSEVYRAIALVYNETRGLRDGPNNDLQAGREAVAEVVLNGGKMNAADHLTLAEQIYIWGDDNGNGQRPAEIAAYRSSAEAVAWAVANRGDLDPTGGARFLDIYSGGYNHYASRGIPALLSYGPFYNAGGPGGGERCMAEPCAYVYIYTRY